MNCDPIARWYRWMEYAAFGGALRRRREAFLFELGNPQKVLVLGDGDGRFLQSFTALYPRAKVEALDASERMLEMARARVPSENVTFHHADVREFVFEETYDLAVAHFFFDCFETEELKTLLTRVRADAWLVSEFQSVGWRWPIVRALYLFFRISTGLRVTSLPGHPVVLQDLGFQLEQQQNGLGGLLVSEHWVRASLHGQPPAVQES